MKTSVLTLVLALIIQMSLAQQIVVIDKTDLQPISGVYIYNKSKTISALSDERGRADLSEFGKDEELTFQHRGYEEIVAQARDFDGTNNKIPLVPSLIGINEVVISANKWEQSGQEIANRIASMNAKQIEFQNPQTSADLLQRTGLVYIQKSQLGGGSPMLRGFAANRVLIVVDGVRMNNAIFRSGNLQNVISLDANALEGSEVIFGPGSVIYGSDALGGVMDFHTRGALLSTSANPLLRASGMTRYSSANSEKTANMALNLGWQKIGLFSCISYSVFDDLRMGSHGPAEYLRTQYAHRVDGSDSTLDNSNPLLQKPTGYSQFNILQKLRFRPNEKLDINYSFHHSETSDLPRYDRLLEYRDGKLRDGDWHYGPQIWNMNHLKSEWQYSNLFFSRMRTSFSHQIFEESRHNRDFGDDVMTSRLEHVTVLSTNFDFEKNIDEIMELFYGIEATHNQVRSEGFNKNILTNEQEPTSSRYPDGATYQSQAIYANINLPLGHKLNINAGARMNHVSLKCDFSDKTFYNFPYDAIELSSWAANGSLGISFRPAASWQLSANLSNGFRAPNVDDIGKIFDSEPGNVLVPNPELGPETVRNLEFGVVKMFDEQAKIQTTIFGSTMQNVITRRAYSFNGQDSILYDGTLSQVEALVNAEHAVIYGVQLSGFIQILNGLGLESHLTITKGFEEDSLPLRHAPPTYGRTSLSYQTRKIRIGIEAEYNAKIAHENLAPSELDKPHLYAIDDQGRAYFASWHSLNSRLSYQLNEYLQLNLGLENMTDQRYKTYSSGIVAPGRNWIFTFRARF